MKKRFLYIHLMFLLFLASCQQNNTYTIHVDANTSTDSLILNSSFPGYGVMIAKQNNESVLLFMKSSNSEMEVEQIIPIPVTDDTLKITDFYLNENKLSSVILNYSGESHTYDVVKRIGLFGHYNALELNSSREFFDVEISDGCFGQNQPCPFSSRFDSFISGPYVNYQIRSLLKLQKPQLALPSYVDHWYTIDLSNRVISVLAEYQGNLYHISVVLKNNELVYTSILVEENIKYASFVGSNQTSLVISQNNAIHIYNSTWSLMYSANIDGDYQRVIKDYHDGPYVIETNAYYYVYKGSTLLESITKQSEQIYVAATIVYEPSEKFVYYYLENNQIKLIETDL